MTRMDANAIAFYIFAAITIIASFGGLAGLYVLLDAPFVAVTQIIVYAGAIMVLFLFVVMLLNVPREEAPLPGLLSGRSARRFGVLLALALAVELVWAMIRLAPMDMQSQADGSGLQSVRAIGGALYTTHAFAFEATSVLILVAMVGAIILARKETR